MNRSHHIRMKLLLVAGDRTTNNVRSVVSISGGLGRPFNHGLRGAQPLYHHWTVSRANCGYISLSPWPAHCNDLLVCCRRSTDTKHGGRIGCIYNLYLILFKKKKRNHDRDGFVVLRPNIANDTVFNLMWFLTFSISITCKTLCSLPNTSSTLYLHLSRQQVHLVESLS